MDLQVISSIFGLFAAIAAISLVFLILGGVAWAASKVLTNRD